MHNAIDGVSVSMKRLRQQKILEIISSRRVESQQELAEQLLRRGVGATQSSVSRDIDEMGLVKTGGFYSQPRDDAALSGPLVEMDTAGDQLIIIKTEIGEAQPTALHIDRAKITEIIGTIAGDDTIFIAVKNQAAQRLAMTKISRLLSPRATGRARAGRAAKATKSIRSRGGAVRSAAR